MLSWTDSVGTTPSALRSSGMKAMPAAMAARVEPRRISWPSIETVPASSGCAPKMALAVDERPEPEEAGQADDLATADRDIDVLDDVVPAEAPGSQDDLVGRPRRSPRRSS